MNALWPRHSSTPKSASKLSVMVTQGISQPIRAFRRAMSACGAREAYTRVVSRAFRWARWPTWSAPREQPMQACSPGREEGAVDDQLTAALEQVEQARFAFRPVELVLLLHGQPRHPPTLGGQCVTGAGQGLLLHQHLLARSFPLLRRNNVSLDA